MRGLDARVYLAIARVHELLYPGDCALGDALTAAESEGCDDYIRRNCNPPVMFQSEPVLLEAWFLGYNRTATAIEEFSFD